MISAYDSQTNIYYSNIIAAKLYPNPTINNSNSENTYLDRFTLALKMDIHETPSFINFSKYGPGECYVSSIKIDDEEYNYMRIRKEYEHLQALIEQEINQANIDLLP